ncbi:hypothetical protein [Mycobacterium tuberculosis]|uniref:hypothetical protein n=1 Tax=Mycobacterium tuberculosis TaxID=1773 RepID=UPI00272D7177|nr:hypothetical protein [Mycobacterium tuberculosis]
MLSPIARLLLAPLRGSHRRQAGPYCPAPPRPAARVDAARQRAQVLTQTAAATDTHGPPPDPNDDPPPF